MKTITKLTTMILAAVFVWSCDTSQLETRLDNLEGRIAALETTVGEVNANATAIRAIMKEGIRIVEYTYDGTYGYSLSLSNGTIVKVIFGKTAPGIIPVIGINADGKWVMSYDGENFEVIKGAQNIDAEDGLTPQVRVGSDGNWQVSTDGGKTWTDILGADGKPISAVDGASAGRIYTVFRDVFYDSSKEEMVFILATDGKEVRVPVVNNFDIKINGYTAGERILLGQTISYEVELTGVANMMFQVPDGWSAEYADGVLSVTSGRSGDAGEYTVSVIVVSVEGLLKRIDLTFNLVAEFWTESYCKVFNDFTAGNEENVLLDFSYAGYAHGESAPLEASMLGYTVYDVTDYGAVPNDGKSDREAFLACLKAALGVDYEVNANNIITFGHKEKANAIVYFPEGEFILHTADDDVASETASDSQTIQIRSGNFVLRGAGRDKTTIIMQDPNQPASSALYSSPAMIELKHNSGLTALTDVTANAVKGSFSVEVASTAGLSEGQWVCLTTVNNDPAFVKAELAAGNPTETEIAGMTNITSVGVQVYDYHQIAKISGNTVTFVEPIMHEVDLQYTAFTGTSYNWRIAKYPHYENVGIEDLTFKGNCKDNFVHHGSWEDDGAYKPINMTRLTNSWMRRVGFDSVSEASSLTNCANISVYDVTFKGTRGHSAIRSQVSSRVFIGATVDNASGYLIDSPSTFCENAGQYHAVGVSKQSMGTVLWRNVWGDDSCFESHATQPRATLIDCCKGGWMRWRQGGDEIQVPNHLADLTVWNFESTTPQSETFIWWDHTSKWWKFLPPVVVGFHGQATTFEASQTKLEESNGIPVNPESLYEAQLKLRLGAVPAWLASLKK
ncbi:MAG: DUF4955 domain-containing protein [Candidatus Cryptobacteroides sp.]